MAKRILSGVQPSGKLHLGNYFGAIQQHIALQDRGDASPTITLSRR
jgi:tryptophanyl-tRNA synthetase